MRTTWTLPLWFFVKECILTRKRKIAVIAWVHTVGWDKGSEIGWLLEMQYLKSDGSNLEIYSVTDRKPVEISKNRRNVAKAKFLGNDPSKCVLDKLQASQIRNRCASKERVYNSRVSNPLSRQLLSCKPQQARSQWGAFWGRAPPLKWSAPPLNVPP